MNQVSEALEAHFEELDGEALSRLAWLYIHSRKKGRVKRVILQGLATDPQNSDIIRLAKRNHLV